MKPALTLAACILVGAPAAFVIYTVVTPPTGAPVNAPLTVGFGNVGRTKHGSSWGVDKDALGALFAAMPAERWAVLLCEIGEGDDNDELALAKRLAPKGSTFYCQASREPIVLSPDFGRAHSRVVWVPNTSVPRWSPQRSINVVHLPGENTVLLGGHPAAGAYHGDRPALAKRALVKSWDKTFAAHRLIEQALHDRDKNVIWAMDTTARTCPTPSSVSARCSATSPTTAASCLPPGGRPRPSTSAASTSAWIPRRPRVPSPVQREGDLMPLNPPRPVRAALYVLTAVGTPIAAYLNLKGYIGDPEMVLWAAEVTVVNGLAALNTSAPEEI
jgi:hypothetical protein